MSEMSPGAALRQLQQAQAGLKKARQVMKLARGDADANRDVIKAGWESLARPTGSSPRSPSRPSPSPS